VNSTDIFSSRPVSVNFTDIFSSRPVSVNSIDLSAVGLECELY
jgi:hypothetical protein